MVGVGEEVVLVREPQNRYDRYVYLLQLFLLLSIPKLTDALKKCDSSEEYCSDTSRTHSRKRRE